MASALAASCVLHAFLLWPAASRDREGEASQTISAVLMPAEKQRQPARISSPATALPVPRMPERKHPSVPEDSQRLLSSSGTPPQANTPTSTPEIALRSGGPVGGPIAAAREAGATAANDAAGQALDADGVRQYRVALATQARRFKRYPQSALADEIGGTVEVRVAVAAGGQAQEVALARSSGYGALDEAALEMMRKAAPHTAVPEPLRRRAFAVNLPVVFDVANE